MGKRKGKRGKAAKNARKGMSAAEPEELVKAPHSFVINRGKLGKNGNELMINFRKIMEPYTAANLKVQKQNVMKDFIHMAGPLHVTHMAAFTKSDIGMYVKILKLPHGPTLTFQIKEYALIRDIISSQKRSLIYEKLFENHPLLILNNFSGEGMHFKLMTTMFQNMFPSINVNKTNLNAIRRCLLLHYNEDKTIDLRQFAVKIVPSGVSKAVKKLIQSKVPNLSQYQDIGEFMQKSGNLSESEAELDTPANTVVLPQPISSRGNIASERSAIRLYEIGPRMTLQLLKIEEGIMSGEVLYHDLVKKSAEEVKALKKKIKEKRLLKEQRREQQRKNVEKKQQQPSIVSVPENEKEESDEEKREDIEWYRKEVGEDPDESILPRRRKRRMSGETAHHNKKSRTGSFEKSQHSSEKWKGDSSKKFQQILAERKKKKDIKLAKKKSKINSNKFFATRAKHRENKIQKTKKNS